MRVVIQTPPAAEPITDAEALEHLREDAAALPAIRRRAKAARQHLEQRTGLTLITTTFDVFLSSFPGVGGVSLPPHPLQSISSIVSIAEDGTETVVDPELYYQAGQRLCLRKGAEWPTVTRRLREGIRVRCVAGFGDASSAETEDLRAAILAILGTLHANRESVVTGSIVSRIDELVGDVISNWCVYPPFEAY